MTMRVLLLGARGNRTAVSLLVVACVGLWAALFGATFVALPRIAPPEMPDGTTALVGQLGVIVLALTPAPHLALLGRDGSGWLQLSPRNDRLIRASRLGVQLSFSAACGIATVSLVPAKLNYSQLAGIWLAAWGVGLLACAAWGTIAAVAIPGSLTIFLSIPKMVPWSRNFIFNPDLVDTMRQLGILTFIAGALVFSYLGGADDRRR